MKKEKKLEDKPSELEAVMKKPFTYHCPVRGLVTQEVEVKRYKAQAAPEHKPVDPEIAELLNSEIQELEEAGFHEEKLN